MTDEKIIKAAKELNSKIPVFSKRVYENELKKGYNYIVFRKGGLVRNNCNSYSRTIEIIYVYDGKQELTDYEIINSFIEIGLVFKGMEPDDFQVGSTNKWVDMNIYSFERPERG